MGIYDNAYVTLNQVRIAVENTRGYLAYHDMVGLLEWMERDHIERMPWFRMSTTQREILEWAGIRPVMPA